MDDATIKKEIAAGFEYSYQHDDWVTPLDEALAGLTFEEALWKRSSDSKSIWEIVLHLAVWNENIVERVRSGTKARPVEGAWPPLPSVHNEVTWEGSKRRLWNALNSVRTMIEETPLAAIQAGPYGVGDLLCRATHNAYHIGQITKIREFSN